MTDTTAQVPIDEYADIVAEAMEHKTAFELDIEAAVKIEGWTSISQDDRGAWGDPPVGQRRPVIRYSKDASRGVHLAKRMAGRIGAEIEIVIKRDGVDVDVYCTSPLEADFSESNERVEKLPEILVRCSLFLEGLRQLQIAAGNTKNHQEEAARRTA